jgi:tetratricopeptide (TPR) repeat protein
MQLARYAEAERVFRDEVELLRAEAEARPDDLTAPRELGPALSKLGNALQQQSRFDLAEPVYREAIEALRSLHARAPDHVVDPSLASLSYDLGVIDRHLGRYAEAEEAFGWAQAIEVARVAEHPEDPELAYRAGLTVLERALVTRQAGDPGKAADGAREAGRLLGMAYERVPGNAAYAHAFAKAHGELAEVLTELERFDEAGEELAQATELYSKLVRDFPNVPVYGIGLAGTEAARAQLYDSLEKPVESEAAMRGARDAFAALAARYPTLADFQGNLSMTNAMLAGMVRRNGRPDEALALLREALAQQREGLRLAPGSAVHGKLLSQRRADLARALVAAEDFAEARELAPAIAESDPGDALAHAAAAGVLAACAQAPAGDSALADAARTELARALELDSAAVLAVIDQDEWAALRADATCAAALDAARARR